MEPATSARPRINATDYAITRINQVRANQKQPEAGVRIAITGRTDGNFVYDLQLVAPGEEQTGDVVVQGPAGIPFHIPLGSVTSLDNITVDADQLTGALTVDNPNPLWPDPLAQEVQTFLDDEINPYVATHGGHIDLLDVSDGVAYVHMGGGCQGCGMASVTLTQGVRASVKERFPDIHDVIDTTDHAQGTNPYYQAAKK
ncbi:MAG TPA: NifU family protein [Candidatus Sulfotelmatobacter sp.]|nr:NifU family protein [Candidatus Sulfotelmatobacter sp.]